MFFLDGVKDGLPFTLANVQFTLGNLEFQCHTDE